MTFFLKSAQWFLCLTAVFCIGIQVGVHQRPTTEAATLLRRCYRGTSVRRVTLSRDHGQEKENRHCLTKPALKNVKELQHGKMEALQTDRAK